jgi:Kef-type K+ transport system membrane component KefB
MDHSGKVLLEIFLMFGAGKLLGEMAERLRQPAVIGEILAGVALGPAVLGLVQPSEMNRGLAEIGAIFLLFTVGLETKPGELLKVGWIATLVATVGVVMPFLFGFAYIKAVGHDAVSATFVGAAMVATSVGITARVLADAKALSFRFARVILGAAVIDDILGMIVLAVVSSLAAGKVNYLSLAIVTIEAVGFSLLLIFFGSRLVGQFQPVVGKLRAQNSAFALAVILCLGLSLASAYIGMAAIIGAFLAGLVLADHSKEWQLLDNARPVSEFLTPFFFVLLGSEVNLQTIRQPAVLTTAAVVCLLAIVSKLLGCGVGALSLGMKDAMRVGVGMVPRGEVGLIVAAVGLHLHTISDTIYTVVVLMTVVTTIIAPPVLNLILPGEAELAAISEDSCQL